MTMDVFRKIVLASPATSLPLPSGPFRVGYSDVMTPGGPDTGSMFRLLYPAPAHTPLTSPPSWDEANPRQGILSFLEAMTWNWPTWVNSSEFLLLPAARKFLSASSFSTLFRLGWGAAGRQLTIPIVRGAPLEAGHWPVVVFSHGMGCSRATMSQLCYQLASQGVVVAAVEHRDGSGCGSSFVTETEAGDLITCPVPHRHVAAGRGEYEARHGQIRQRSDEIRRVIDILAKLNAGESVPTLVDTDVDLTGLASCLDMTTNLFLLGHSFGGSSVLLAASEDPRVKAVLALDPWMFPLSRHKFTIRTPTEVINTEKFLNDNNLQVIKNAAIDDSVVKFRVMGSGVHLSATDVPAVFLSQAIRRGLGFMDKVEPEQVMEETNQLVLRWLQKNI